jgi:hypothetical protein
LRVRAPSADGYRRVASLLQVWLHTPEAGQVSRCSATADVCTDAFYHSERLWERIFRRERNFHVHLVELPSGFSWKQQFRELVASRAEYAGCEATMKRLRKEMRTALANAEAQAPMTPVGAAYGAPTAHLLLAPSESPAARATLHSPTAPTHRHDTLPPNRAPCRPSPVRWRTSVPSAASASSTPASGAARAQAAGAQEEKQSQSQSQRAARPWP